LAELGLKWILEHFSHTDISIMSAGSVKPP